MALMGTGKGEEVDMLGSEVLLGYRTLPDLGLRFEHGNPPLVLGNKRRCKMRTEAVQIEMQAGPVPSSEQGLAPHGVEAGQIEEQARALGRVIRDPPNARLPATAWPRQTLAVMYVTQRPLHESGRGDCDPPFAGNNGGEDEGRFLALMQGSSRYDGWWCKVRL